MISSIDGAMKRMLTNQVREGIISCRLLRRMMAQLEAGRGRKVITVDNHSQPASPKVPGMARRITNPAPATAELG